MLLMTPMSYNVSSERVHGVCCHFFINPLLSLTLQSARDLNVPCQPKRSKALLVSCTFKCLLKKMQSFCPCSRALNRSGKWVKNECVVWIFSPVVLLMLQELKYGKLSSKFGLTLFIHVDIHNKNSVCYIVLVLYVHERILLCSVC
jgi:hypothetical protein